MRYDALRIVAALAVVAIHVMAAGMGARGPVGAAAPWLTNTYTFIWFATPSFAFMTAALIWGHKPIRSWPEYRSFLRRRASVVLIPYLFWSAFYIAYGRYTPADLRPAMPLGSYVIDVVKLLLLGRASFHLYFIPVVLEFYLVAPLVARAFARRPWITGLSIWAIGAFTTLVVKAPTSEHLVTLYRMLQYTLWLLPAAAAGGWYGAMRTRIEPVLSRIWPLLLAAGLTLRWYDVGPLLVTTPWQQRIVETTALVLTLVGLISMLEFVLRHLPKAGPHMQKLGEIAFAVYLIHPVVVAILSDAIEGLGYERYWTSPVFTVAAIVVVVLVSFVAAWTLMMIPGVSWVFGRGTTRRSSSLEPVNLPVSPTTSPRSDKDTVNEG